MLQIHLSDQQSVLPTPLQLMLEVSRYITMVPCVIDAPMILVYYHTISYGLYFMVPNMLHAHLGTSSNTYKTVCGLL